jgi:outer membrane receptor protein involved in Fe transport
LSEPGKAAPAAFTGRAGSFGYLRAASDARAGSRLVAHLDYVQSDENFTYYDDNGTPFTTEDDADVTREHNRFRRVTFLPRAALYRSDEQRLDLFSLDTYGDTQVPGPVDIPTDAKLTELFSLSALHHRWQPGEAWVLDSVAYGRYHAQHLINQSADLSPGLPDSSAKDWALGLRTHLRFPDVIGVRTEATLGMISDRYSVEASNAPEDRATKSRLQVPMGISLSVPVAGRAVVFKPALLGHFYHYGIDGSSGYRGTAFAAAPSRDYWLASPRLGMTSSPFTFLRLRATVGSYYRAPSLFELYGDPTGVTPSRDLTYERAWKGDVGADLQWRRPASWCEAVRVSYTFALSRAHNLIDYVQNSQQTRVAMNVGESRILTHEVALEARAVGGVGMRAGFALLGTRNLSDVAYLNGKELPGRPSYRAAMDFNFERGRLRANYGMTFYGPSYWDLANQRRLSSTVEHHLSASLDLSALGAVGLEIRNLTDVTTADTTMGNQVTTDNTTGYLGYPAPGRRVYLTWKYAL